MGSLQDTYYKWFFKYFLTIIDDHSRAIWTILIPTKQHVIHSLQEFYAYVQNQFHVSIKCIRSDNGGEFVNSELSNFLAKHGIIHQTTCPYTPQQNGRVERRHRSLLEMTRALKFQGSLPDKFWGDCLLTSTYLLNRISSPVLGNLSPYEKLFNQPPTYDHLRAFGCLAFMSQHDSDKLSPRAIKTVFLGYPLHKKGYKLYDIATQTFHVSRHVKFNEDIFPFSDVSFSSDVTQLTTDYDSLDTPLDSLKLINQSMSSYFHDNSPSYSVPSTDTDHVTHTPDDYNFSENVSSNFSTSPSSFPHPTYSHEPNIENLPDSANRTSSRVKSNPIWMKDYILNSTVNQPVAHAHTVLTSCTIDPQKFGISQYSPPSTVYACSVSPVTAIQEPFSFKQAINDDRWITAMDKELSAMEANNTWTIVSLPPGKKVVGCKWVYKIKYLSDGSIDKFKA